MLLTPVYYVYRLEHWSHETLVQLYIGSRKSSVAPEEDFGKTYFSSGTLRRLFQDNPEQFRWSILSVHSDVKSAGEEEYRQIGFVWEDPRCVNKHRGQKFRYDEEWKIKHAEGMVKRNTPKNRLAQFKGMLSHMRENNPSSHRLPALEAKVNELQIRVNETLRQEEEIEKNFSVEGIRIIARIPKPIYDAMCHIRDMRHITMSQIIRQGIDMFLNGDHQIADPPTKTLTDEHRANRKLALDPVHQETMRKMHATPEWREKNAAANRKMRESPEWRANHAAAMRKMHESPEWRETMRKTYESPEWRANHAAGIHKRSQDPEFGKKLSEGKKRARAARVKSLFS